MPNETKKWSTEQVIQARQTEIKPILENLGHKFIAFHDENYNLLGSSEQITVKENYWHNRDDRSGGNAIDLLINHFDYTFAGVRVDGGIDALD